MIKKLAVLFLFISLSFNGAVFAGANEYYELGNKYMKNNQFSYAINEYKKVLRIVPADYNARISLINAYLSRATYYNNKALDYSKAGYDLRSALFYMQIFEDTAPDTQMQQAIATTNNNLNNVNAQLKVNQDLKTRFELAKKLRNQGEFAASAYEYFYTKDAKDLKIDSYIALGDLLAILSSPVKSAFYYEQAANAGATGLEFNLKMARAFQKIGNETEAVKAYNAIMQESGDNEEVLASLENIWKNKIQLNSDDAEAYANLGVICQKRGEFEAARSYYQKAESINPSNVTTRLNFGLLYQTEKNYVAAIEAYDSILKLYPNHVESRVFKAQCLEALGRKDEAVQEYRRALAFDPSNEIARKTLYIISKNSMTQDQLISYLKDIYSLDQTNANAAYELAFELHKFKQYDEAINYYKIALQYDPYKVDAYINLSQIYNLNKNFSASRQILDEGLKILPKNSNLIAQLDALNNLSSNVYVNEASTLYNDGRYDDAIVAYSKIQPQTVEGYIGLGASYQAKDDFKSAITYFKKALALKQNDAMILYYIASNYSLINDLQNAKFYVEKALSIEPTNDKIREMASYIKYQQNTMYLQKAIEQYDAKNYTQSYALLANLLITDPNNAHGYYYRGLVSEAQGKYPNAVLDYKKAYSLDSKLNISLYSLAVCFDYQKQYKNAKEYYKKYLDSVGTETSEYSNYANTRLIQLKDYE